MGLWLNDFTRKVKFNISTKIGMHVIFFQFNIFKAFYAVNLLFTIKSFEETPVNILVNNNNIDITMRFCLGILSFIFLLKGLNCGLNRCPKKITRLVN